MPGGGAHATCGPKFRSKAQTAEEVADGRGFWEAPARNRVVAAKLTPPSLIGDVRAQGTSKVPSGWEVWLGCGLHVQ